MDWKQIFKLWTFASEPDPYSRQAASRDLEGAGVTAPEVIPDIRADGSFWGGNRKTVIRLRDSTDFIDLSTVTNRQSRYKEYERLRSTAEIETAMTVFSDEACVSGDTKVATPFGLISISKLAEIRKPDELFMVYCFDFSKNDIGIGWAFNPRKVGTKKTVQLVLNDGSTLTCTPDHKVLTRDGKFADAETLKRGDHLMPFHRVTPALNERNENRQIARVLTLSDGFKNERSMLDEFRTGKKISSAERVDAIMRCIAAGMSTRQIANHLDRTWSTLDEFLEVEGVTSTQVKSLHDRFPDFKKVISIEEGPEIDVYDMSVKDHRNFATDSAIVHNCQIGDNGHMFDIKVKNPDVLDDLKFLFFHPQMLNMDRKLFSLALNLFVFGDYFLELIIDPSDPKSGVLKTQELPPDSIYRIETVKGRLLEFQQSAQGPDYEALSRSEVTQATDQDLEQSRAIRFAPNQIVHFRIGDQRRTFYPYGVSLIEPARGPAHLMRLMEDSMIVYRLSRAPERRLFYIDCGNMPPFKAEMTMERMKDSLRKVKTFSNRGGTTGNSAGPVEERFQPISQDEDLWIPISGQSKTRVETLPGAQNLGEVDDAVFFRNKLFLALHFPKAYMAQEDLSISRVSVSSISAVVAKHVERLQGHIADGLIQIAIRHLELRGYPPDLYDDLEIKLTSPYPVRDFTMNEINESRYNRAMAVMQAGLFSQFDVLTRILSIPESEAKKIVARAQAQKLMDLRLQMMAQNPELMGVAQAQSGMPELGTDAAGPNGELGSGDQGQMPPAENSSAEPSSANIPEPDEKTRGAEDTYGQEPKSESKPLPEPDEDDIAKYDLGIEDYTQDIDSEDIDVSELDDEPF